VIGLHEAALVGHLRLIAPHAFQQLDGFFQLRQTLAGREKRHAKIGELPRHPSGAEAGNHSPTGDVVCGGDDLSQMGRIAHAGRRHQGAELDPGRDRREAGDHRPGFQNGQLRRLRPVEMITHPKGIEPHGFERSRGFGGRHPGALDLRNRDAEMCFCHGLLPRSTRL
jgi:hypothetical protein